MAAVSGRNTTPSLPPEIWDIIISNIPNSTKLQDLTYAWTECRHVSRRFKNQIEVHFGRLHLAKTFLNFDITYGWGSPIRFVFDRYSNDRKLAIFVPWQGNSNLPSFTSIRAKLERQTSVAWFNNPGQTVQIRQNMNDIVVPYVEFSLENGEISVDWRALYTSYLTEERLYARAYIDEHGQTSNPWSAERQALIAYMEAEMDEASLASMSGGLRHFWHACHRSRDEVRRLRLAYQYQKLTGAKICFDDQFCRDERVALNILYDARAAASIEMFNDEPVK